MASWEPVDIDRDEIGEGDDRWDYSPPQRFPISLKSRNGRVQCVSIIARVTADGPAPLKPDRKRKGNLCQNDYVLTYTLCVLTYISLYLCYHWSG